MKLRLWLCCMDAMHLLGAWKPGDTLRWRAFLWCVQRASDATEWGEPEPDGDMDEYSTEVPF